jgi:hypothetical protein
VFRALRYTMRKAARTALNRAPAIRSWLYAVGMSERIPPGQETPEREDAAALPRHLSALVGSLCGPADLGSDHDKYLAYAGDEKAGGHRRHDLVPPSAAATF